MRARLAVSTAAILLVSTIVPATARAEDIGAALADEFGRFSYADGYVWRTGMLGSYHRPRKFLEQVCQSDGGRLQQTLNLRSAREVSFNIEGRRTTISSRDVWRWSGEVFAGYAEENEVSQSSFVVSYPLPDWVPPEAFGLFGCVVNSAEDPIWSIAVMVHHPHILTLREIDLPLVLAGEAEQRGREFDEQQEAERRRQATIAANELAARRQAQEDARLAPWREALDIGDTTNCGMVIDTRGPIVQIQLPPGWLSPEGQREFWARRTSLTDAPPGQGCRYGR